MIYRYTLNQQPARTCPLCGSDWTVHDGILVIPQDKAGQTDELISARLDAAGTLTGDTAELLHWCAQDQVASIECAGCLVNIFDLPGADCVRTDHSQKGN